MTLHTHLVVAYNHETKTFWFDGDGSREWIRRLFDEETNTWSDEQENFIAVDDEVENEAVEALAKLGFEVSENNWQRR